MVSSTEYTPKARARLLGSTDVTRPVLIIFAANNGDRRRQNLGSHADAQHSRERWVSGGPPLLELVDMRPAPRKGVLTNVPR
jgi:hypothetical protein